MLCQRRINGLHNRDQEFPWSLFLTAKDSKGDQMNLTQYTQIIDQEAAS